MCNIGGQKSSKRSLKVETFHLSLQDVLIDLQSQCSIFG